MSAHSYYLLTLLTTASYLLQGSFFSINTVRDRLERGGIYVTVYMFLCHCIVRQLMVKVGLTHSLTLIYLH